MNASNYPQNPDKTPFDTEKFSRDFAPSIDEMSYAHKAQFAAERNLVVAKIKAGLISPGIARQHLYDFAHPFLQEARMDHLKSALPPEFIKELDRAKMKNCRAHDQVMRWGALDYTNGPDEEPSAESVENQDKGVVAYGATGRGKTRSLVSLLARDYLEMGPDNDFEFVRTVDLSAQVRRLAPRHGNELDRFMERLLNVPRLLLDDLHQAKLTPRYAEELIRLVDTRTSYCGAFPLFISCQMPGEELVEAMVGKEDHMRPAAEAIVRRISDYCIPVNFDFTPEPDVL